MAVARVSSGLRRKLSGAADVTRHWWRARRPQGETVGALPTRVAQEGGWAGMATGHYGGAHWHLVLGLGWVWAGGGWRDEAPPVAGPVLMGGRGRMVGGRAGKGGGGGVPARKKMGKGVRGGEDG